MSQENRGDYLLILLLFFMRAPKESFGFGGMCEIECDIKADLTWSFIYLWLKIGNGYMKDRPRLQTGRRKMSPSFKILLLLLFSFNYYYYFLNYIHIFKYKNFTLNLHKSTFIKNMSPTSFRVWCRSWTIDWFNGEVWMTWWIFFG